MGSTKLNNNDGMRNGGVGGDEKISPPRTPIIFVLGGPGSGKITHCDRVVQERSGLAHINMTDLIQQHIVGNGGKMIRKTLMFNYMRVLKLNFCDSTFPRRCFK